MDISNIALVRATNIIPFDGIVKTISNSQYLCKEIGTPFSNKMSDLLKKLGIIPPLDFSILTNEELLKEKAQSDLEILKQYLPYSSSYNSMVLFSLNGLCPDDSEIGFGNNSFSNKKCAIIEPLIHHINDVVSLIPTDTAIKGNVHLSNEAIVLIENETYNNLSDIEKEKLRSLNVKLFNGSLEEAVWTVLETSERYIPEKLSLSRENNGFIPSKTSENQIKLINQIASSNNIAQVLFFNILSGQNDDVDKLENVKDELDNAQTVSHYYLSIFLEELFTFLQFPNLFKENIVESMYNPIYFQKIIELIEENGIENYKIFINQYNHNLEQQREKGLLRTPEEIIKDLKKVYE